MILEDATWEAFRYEVWELKPRSNKSILVVCEQCGKIRITAKNKYHYFCKSCSHVLGEKLKGEKVKCICRWCKKLFEVCPSTIDSGGGIYCCRKCYIEALTGKNNPLWRGGKKVYLARGRDKRKRELGYTLLMPLAEGEDGHHVTDEHVIGIPKEVHEQLGGYSRKKHRMLILQWLKMYDKNKYDLAVFALLDECTENKAQI